MAENIKTMASTLSPDGSVEIPAGIELPNELKKDIMRKQILFLFAVAASVSLAMMLVLWSQEPNYSILYGSLTDKDATEVLTALDSKKIKYKLDKASGAVLVPTQELHEIRMNLANEGLPHNSKTGFSMLQQEQPMGTSQFLEKLRYQHALETELAMSISSVSVIRNARVHLAIPKESVFVRKRKEPSASVLVELYNGNTLEQEQVAAISRLISSSVPNLKMKNVSIVDQYGRLMTHEYGSEQMALSSSQFNYRKNVEQSYITRVEDILIPILGTDRVKAQVTAELDFSMTEQTSESFNPDLPAIRSEQVEENNSVGSLLGGVPGALSNRPPLAATAPEEVNEQNPNVEASSQEGSSQKRSTRNYELDKTISHTRMSMGNLKRLSVAVVVDHKHIFNEDGTSEKMELSPEEIIRLTALVKDAIGYSELRGDTVNVMNAAFSEPQPIMEIPSPPIWEQTWFWDVIKQVGAAGLLLFLIFGVLKPSLKNLATKELTLQQAALALNMPLQTSEEEDEAAKELSDIDKERLELEQTKLEEEEAILFEKEKYEKSINALIESVKEDPKRAAIVIKGWMGDE